MTQRFRVPDTISAREVDGELVVLDLPEGEFSVARGVGPRVWGMLTAGRTVDEVVDEIVRRYDLDREQARADIDAFVGSLVEKGMLVREGDDPGSPDPD